MYNKRIGKTAQYESGGKQVINRLEIERTFYNPVNRQPILPGSSIKGAIRTALLNQVNQGRALKHKNERNQALQQRLFQYSMRELQKDPMRLVRIADASWITQTERVSSEVRFAVNRQKKIKMKDGRLLESQAEQKGLFQQLECVAGMLDHAFESQISLQIIEFERGNKLPETTLQWKIEDLFAACNHFYLPKLQQELVLLKQLNYADPQWLAQIEQLLIGKLGTRLQKNQAMLLRLGRHSGAEAVTLDGVRSIKIMQGNGNKPAFESQAKTLWLSASDEKSRQQLVPFGWVIVEIDDDHLLQFELHKDKKISQWLSKIQQQQSTLRQQQDQLEQQRQQKAQQEADELAAKEEQQRIQQQQLEQAKSRLSELAGEFFTQAQQHNWKEDKNAFLLVGKLETWMEKLAASKDQQLAEQIETLVETHFKGIMNNPEKVKGKKKKAVYSARMQKIAKQLIELK